MRELTKKQKNILDAWIDKQVNKDEMFACIHGNPTFNVNGKPEWSLGVDTLLTHNPEIYELLEEINDTEILYQNVERYLWDKSSEINYKS